MAAGLPTGHRARACACGDWRECTRLGCLHRLHIGYCASRGRPELHWSYYLLGGLWVAVTTFRLALPGKRLLPSGSGLACSARLAYHLRARHFGRCAHSALCRHIGAKRNYLGGKWNDYPNKPLSILQGCQCRLRISFGLRRYFQRDPGSGIYKVVGIDLVVEVCFLWDARDMR